MAALPQGSLVLITGANGFISSHVVDQTLKAGLRVRAAVRSEAKGEVVKAYFGKIYPGENKIEYVVVEDMAKDDAYVEAVKNVDGVIHLASVMPNANATYDNLITPSIAGVLSILRAASSSPSIKRFVLTSSSAAGGMSSVNGEVKHWDATTWNTQVVTRDETDPIKLYFVSKTESERAAWDFIKEKKPSFVFNTILPNMNFGRVFPGFNANTGGWIPAIANGHGEFAKTFEPQWFINVADTALIHVLTLLDPTIANERIWAVNAPYSYNQLVKVIRNVKPDAAVPEDFFGEEGEKTPKVIIDFERARKLLEPFGGFKGLEETVRDSLEV